MITLPTQASYIVLPGPESHQLKAYVARCKQHHLPIIYTHPGKEYAKVEMDLIYISNGQTLIQEKTYREKILNACEKSGVPECYQVYYGIYTATEHCPQENAEVLAQTFLAIYQQLQGEQAVLLPFPHPYPFGEVRTQVEKAKKQGYVVTQSARDPLGIRYQTWCDATGSPCIAVYRFHQGYARLDARIPGERPCTLTTRENIRRAAQELGAQCYDSPTCIYTPGILPLALAEELARTVARLLKRQVQ